MENLPGARVLNDCRKNRSVNKSDYDDDDNVLINRDFVNNAPLDVTRNIVRYLDEVFGSLMRRLSEIDEVKAFKHMGGIVDSILRYNNIHFATVNVRNVKQEFNMPEPLWYSFGLDTLDLFVSHDWYESYVGINTNVPVLWQCGNVAVDKFNFTDQDPIVGPMDTAKIKCVIACDHVAQHIIRDYTINCEQLSHTDIHDSWTIVGTTLHSMLDITVYVNPETQQRASSSLTDPYDSYENNSIWSIF